jgi:Dolichyl-phosphate-mannose-protein mannosyltransferase
MYSENRFPEYACARSANSAPANGCTYGILSRVSSRRGVHVSLSATVQRACPGGTRQAEWIEWPEVRWLCLALFFVAVAASYLQWYPHHYRLFTTEDSGIFLHMGQRLLHGDLLYRDISDNKPPLVYWLNALGLFLGHGTPGGVLFLCVVAGLLTFAAVYWGLRDYVGWQVFIITGSLAQIAFLACTKHPNYTETYALPLIAFAAVLFVRDVLEAETPVWHSMAQGAIAALIAALRPNNAGISVISCAYLILGSRRGGKLPRLMLFAASAAVTYVLVLTPLVIHGTFADYRTAAVQLAGTYAAENHLAARIFAFWHGVDLFVTSPLFYLSLACVATVLLSGGKSAYTLLVRWLAVWLLLEMALSSTSGYRWNHYYLLWILPLSLIIMLAGPLSLPRVANSVLPIVLAVGLELVLLNHAVTDTYRAWSDPRPPNPALELTRVYVHSGDRVTTWGYYEHDLWFELDHRPGTRLFHEGEYTNRRIYQALVPTFLTDLEQNRPRVVIERRSAVPLFAPSAPDIPLNDAFHADYFKDWDTAAVIKRKSALAQLYRPILEQSGIVVYLRRE